MANYSGSITGPIFFQSGEVLTVADGATVISATDGIASAPGFDGTGRLSVGGTVTGSLAGIRLEGPADPLLKPLTVQFSSFADVVGQSDPAFTASGLSVLVVNKGFIEGFGSTALSVDGRLDLRNDTGLVQGAERAIVLRDTAGLASEVGQNIVNSGVIDRGIEVIGTPLRLTNSNLIFGNDYAIYAAENGPEEWVRITNSGLIEGYALPENGNVASAIVTGAGDDKIFNTGRIDGVIRLGDGDDVLDSSTGRIAAEATVGFSRVYGGNGNDTLILSDGPPTGIGSGPSANLPISDFAYGEAGNDLIRGLGGADFLYGGDDEDRLYGGVGDDNLFGNSGHDRLFGDDGDDFLVGDAGNDLLDGGAGADILWGGSGNDTYVVDHLDDIVDETGGDGVDDGGIDKVQSSVSFTLSRYVEKLTLVGLEAVNGAGNDLANAITGNAGNNVLAGGGGVDTLSGGAGSDILIGGLGNDILTGGLGNDVFVLGLPAAAGVDKVKDFNQAQDDRVGINADEFGLSEGNGLTSSGTLDAAWFALTLGKGNQGTAEGHGQFVFNISTRALMWDADGAGSQVATTLATFNSGVQLSAADFQIVSQEMLIV